MLDDIQWQVSSGYIKNNQASKAIDLFHVIQKPDDVILILLFNACAQIETPEVLSLIKRVSSTVMDSSRANYRLMATLINALIKCGDVNGAEILFQKIPKNVISYGNLMSGLNKKEQPSKVLKLFEDMKNNALEPDEITYLCVIKALAQIGTFKIAKTIIAQMPKSFRDNLYIQTALVDMWVSEKSQKSNILFIDLISKLILG